MRRAFAGKKSQTPIKDHCHITGRYLRAAHNKWNFKLELKAKTVPIPVVFHNLRGYDEHLLRQAMARVQGEIKCIPTSAEKYILFLLGNLNFNDNVNFLRRNLDSLVKGSDPQSFKITEKMFKDITLLLKKGIYPYEYKDSLERFSETNLHAKRRFTQS